MKTESTLISESLKDRILNSILRLNDEDDDLHNEQGFYLLFIFFYFINCRYLSCMSFIW